MISDSSSFPLLFTVIAVILFLPTWELPRVADGKVHITDDLDDVVDEEEDEAWKEWGKKKTPDFDLQPADLNKMELPQIQEQVLKHHAGPLIGFVKLSLGVRRTPEMVTDIAMKWTKVLRTGALGVKFMGVDTSTVMFNMDKGQDISEFKEFILSQPEAYEVKLGDQVFRRYGDPPLEVVIEKLRREKEEAKAEAEHAKEEL